ncbi:hypothetical protein P7K49_039232 [Saguinus oedipus]|uniref:Uncharacterized protein n=1 Tax=Saguinus oedipus TaxID=9490 RepID=A0ABQ9TGY1_SAGOE|nr:hypothetical protein P7K49_039232 [Saguinus oedipus]
MHQNRLRSAPLSRGGRRGRRGTAPFRSLLENGKVGWPQSPAYRLLYPGGKDRQAEALGLRKAAGPERPTEAEKEGKRRKGRGGGSPPGNRVVRALRQRPIPSPSTELQPSASVLTTPHLPWPSLVAWVVGIGRHQDESNGRGDCASIRSLKERAPQALSKVAPQERRGLVEAGVGRGGDSREGDEDNHQVAGVPPFHLLLRGKFSPDVFPFKAMKQKAARKLSGIIKEILGTVQSVGCNADGQHPYDTIDGINSGAVECPEGGQKWICCNGGEVELEQPLSPSGSILTVLQGKFRSATAKV